MAIDSYALVEDRPVHEVKAERRFWANVDQTADACWEWGGTLLPPWNYGTLAVGGYGTPWRKMLAHRLSWELHFGHVPHGLNVLHHCDNPPCVRPDHLFVGTQADNVADMLAKGRQAPRPDNRGERSSSARLTAENVQEIRRRYAHGGVTQTALAAEYGVCFATIGHAIRRRTWKELA